jgi:anti-sigma factor RsiW
MRICRQYKRLIAAYVDDTASPEERARLEEHLAECEACDRATRELVRTRRLVARLPALQPSPGLMSALSARLREKPIGWLERLWWTFRPADWRSPAATAAALILCIAVGLATLHLHSPMSPPEQPQQQFMAAQTYSPLAETLTDLPADEYVRSCVLIHEGFDHNRAFGTPDEVQLVSYGP